MSQRETKWPWPKPGLNRADQLKFWDFQAPTYESADMTTDNCGELQAVLDVVGKMGPLDDIVVFGGAVGCRDPKAIYEQVFCTKQCNRCAPGSNLPTVFFSDLAPAQVARAKDDILAPCLACGAPIDFHAGSVTELAGCVDQKARTLLLGIYTTPGFFSANPAAGYPMAGFDEYLKNRGVLGDRFWFDWLLVKDGQLVTNSTGLALSADASMEERLALRRRLAEEYATAAQPIGDAEEEFQLAAIQVVSAHAGREGFFLSHWFNPEEANAIVRSAFPPEEFEIAKVRFPKGTLYAITRAGAQPTGVVTVLNNVWGNILPEEQLSTLAALRSII